MNLNAKSLIALVVSIFLLSACSETAPDKVLPEAVQHTFTLTLHGESYTDPYHYLGQIAHPDTLQYLADERAYAVEVIQDWASERALIEREINDHLPNQARSEPVLIGRYHYYRVLQAGAQFPIYYRQLASGDAPEQVVLDVSELASGSSYFHLGSFVVSPDEQEVAFTLDKKGDQRFSLGVRQISTGRIRQTQAHDISQDVGWLGSQLIYVSEDRRHIFSLSPNGTVPVLVYTEPDEASVLSLHPARDRSGLFVTARSPESTDIQLLNETGQLSRIAAREAGHHYQVRRLGDQYYLLTNYRKSSFEIAVVDQNVDDPQDWSYLDLGDEFNGGAGQGPEWRIDDFEVFDQHLVIQISRNMSSAIVLVSIESKVIEVIARSEPGSVVRLSSNPEPGSSTVRYESEGLLQPVTVLEYHFETGIRRQLSAGREPVKDGHVELKWFSASDGKQVPITLIYKGQLSDKKPVLVMGYGAYGIPMSLDYDPVKLPLLDRGFLIALIHVRGGGELGHAWHQQGRLLHKQRAIDDFVDGTRFLVDEGYADPGKIAARGASAGATLVAAALNHSPGLYAAVVLNVPFLDPVNALFDAAHPMTASDHLEWGNPSKQIEYQSMMSWSPYEGIRKQAYPDILLTAAIHDSRVDYAEALKWLARLRDHDTGGALMLIDIDANSGHLGASDQYEMRRRDSLEYAFLLDRLVN